MNLHETFHAFAAKTKTGDDVMRAIMKYDAWQAPVLFASNALHTEMFDRIAIWGTGPNTIPPGELCLFTDDDAANAFVNQRGHAGPYATGLSGSKLFQKLPDGLSRVQINPASPPTDGWVIHKDGLNLTRLWAKAVELEGILARGESGLIEAIIAFEAFTFFVLPSGGIATAVGAGGMKNPGMIFTTPDCADTVAREAGPEVAATLKRGYLSGKDLFSRFASLGIDGFVVNARGPGAAQALRQDVCEGIVDCIALAEKANRLEAEARQMETGA